MLEITPDLGTLLIVTAQCSAAFVAIIGGLVASKAINDVSDENAVRVQMEQIDNDVKTLESRYGELQKWLTEEAAQDFIEEHFAELINDIALNEVHGSDADENIAFAELQPYWEDAQKCVRATIHDRRSNPEEALDDNGIPVSDAGSMSDFVKAVCRRNRAELERQSGASRAGTRDHHAQEAARQAAVTAWNDAVEEQDAVAAGLDKRKLTREILTERLTALTRRSMVRGGGRMFLIASLVNVVMPLVLFLFVDQIEASGLHWPIAIIVLGLFIAGVVMMTMFMTKLYRFGDASSRQDD